MDFQSSPMDCMRNHFQESVHLDGRFQTISPLNHGSFGMVFLAKDMLTDELVALKCLTKPSSGFVNTTGFAVDDRSEELAIHARIGQHPNIVNLLHSFETKTHVYLVLEFCANGDLYEAIRQGKGPLETEHVRDFMFQLVDAVEFLHSKGLYHRDIKPENIFLSQSGSMKLGDFGLATADEWSYESAVGSDRYMAPEQLDPCGNGYSPAKADVWAIGICLLNVLFSRNPFATPNPSDPLFADFVRDKQSLFDVFPNMSQDTFEILVHCLAIDPEKRSLAAVREALERVVSFTTDDESLDDFCTEDREVIPASANREPLRTPSITTPQLEPTNTFPWAKALKMTPQQPTRQLSVIPDNESYTEELFPASERSDRDWCSIKADNSPFGSFANSGLGLSISPAKFPQIGSKPVDIVGSLPVPSSRTTMASVFSKKRAAVSKSWSDMWDEEEEENSELERGNDTGVRRTFKERMFGKETGSGRATPRNGLAELKNPATVNNSRDRTPEAIRTVDSRVSEHTGFLFESPQACTPRYPISVKRGNLDKWAALGDRRRGASPAAQDKQACKPSPSPARKRTRSRTGSWKRTGKNSGRGTVNTGVDWCGTRVSSGVSFNVHEGTGVWDRRGHVPHTGVGDSWSLSKDWRQPAWPQQHQRVKGDNDDIGDLEWVGGWHDLHL